MSKWNCSSTLQILGRAQTTVTARSRHRARSGVAQFG